MKYLILLLLLTGCSASNKAPQHVKTVNQAKYYVKQLDSIERDAATYDSVYNLNKKP